MRSTTKLFGAAVVAGTVAFAGSALAQGQKSTAKPTNPPAPAAQPAQGQPAQGGQPGQPQGPMRVDLQAVQPNWTKVCGKDPQTQREVCLTTRDFTTQPDQPPLLAIAINEMKGEDQKVVRFLMPLMVLLKPGIRFTVDKNAQVEAGFDICYPNGCAAEARVKGAFVEQMKKGQHFLVSAKNAAGAEITFALPLDGFGKAYDGPAIDPKVLEEQQKQLQEQLQKKAEEERKKLQAQQGGAPAAPGAAPAAPAAPA
ncbi:MAG: invasion associated locus B family protein, partial [Hyphomicrobiales bacterium]|nr:invasion associated locus B family protein [Hyphomicrobiales bacterium]